MKRNAITITLLALLVMAIMPVPAMALQHPPSDDHTWGGEQDEQRTQQQPLNDPLAKLIWWLTHLGM